jgi:hypothetical protein
MEQDKHFQAHVSMFQTVYSNILRHQVPAVLCNAQLLFYLLSLPLSSLASQAVKVEELFIFSNTVTLLKSTVDSNNEKHCNKKLHSHIEPFINTNLPR